MRMRRSRGCGCSAGNLVGCGDGDYGSLGRSGCAGGLVREGQVDCGVQMVMGWWRIAEAMRVSTGSSFSDDMQRCFELGADSRSDAEQQRGGDYGFVLQSAGAVEAPAFFSDIVRNYPDISIISRYYRYYR